MQAAPPRGMLTSTPASRIRPCTLCRPQPGVSGISAEATAHECTREHPRRRRTARLVRKALTGAAPVNPADWYAAVARYAESPDARRP